MMDRRCRDRQASGNAVKTPLARRREVRRHPASDAAERASMNESSSKEGAAETGYRVLKCAIHAVGGGGPLRFERVLGPRLCPKWRPVLEPLEP